MPRKKPDLDALIEALIAGDQTETYRIEDFGAKAVPALVRAMDDPRACQPTRWAGPAILRIWELLIFRATPEAIARMAAFADHDNDEIRRGVYGMLIWYGSSACADALVRAWRARGEEDQDRITLSVWRQVKETRGRWEPGFIAALFDLILERLSAVDPREFPTVANTLLELDPKRARAFLTSPEVFRPDNPQVVGVLLALDAAGAVVPAPALVAMLPALRAWSDAQEEGRTGFPYEVALSVLARSGPAAARPLVEEALRSDNAFRRERAGGALEILERVDEAVSVVQDAVAELAEDAGAEGLDFDLLDDAHAHYYLAHQADEAIRNDGLMSYLLETPHENIVRAPEALEAIGATRAAESVRQAEALVRKLRPRKGEALIQMFFRPEVSARLSELQAPFLQPAPGEEVGSLLRLYTLRKPDEFRPKSKTRKKRR